MYEPCRVEAVGTDWVILRGQGGRVYFGGGFDIHEKLIMREKAE